MLSRRPLIDCVQDEEEKKHWGKVYDKSNSITVYSWRNDWLQNIKDNLKHFGYFHRDNAVKVFHGELANQPAILVGAGPSLELNIKYLALAKEKGIKIIAGHHGLMYMAREDIKIKPDFVLTLDSGSRWDDYYAFDKFDYSDVPLLADMTCNTNQLKQWKGPVFFYKSAYPDNIVSKHFKMEVDRLIGENEYPSMMEVGGHAMGAAMAIAKGILTANQILFVGCDYCFNPFSGKFYPFDHEIDKEVDSVLPNGTKIRKKATPNPEGQCVDIFGNAVHSTTAYLGFKNVMDLAIRINKATAMSQNQELDFINCSEGGILGALDGGNSKWMQYMRLEDGIHYAAQKRDKLKQLMKSKED